MSKHLKPQRGLGRAVSSQRAKIKREVGKQQARQRKMEMEQTIAELRSASNGLRDTEEQYEERRQEAEASKILAVVSQGQTAVMRSYGLTQRVQTRVSYSTSALTDYNNVVVSWARPANLDLRYNVVELKGLFQHEMGHLLHSLSPKYLRNHHLWQGAIERINGEHDGNLLHTINILEDQRMESKMVRDVPRLATYFTVIVGLHIARSTMSKLANNLRPIEPEQDVSWLLIAGRNYLPKTIRDESMQAFDTVTGGKSEQWYEIVRRYKSARSVKALLDASVEAHLFINKYLSDVIKPDTHDSHNDSWGGGEAGQPTSPEEADQRINNGAVESPDIEKPQPDNSISDGMGGGTKQESQDGSEQSNQRGSKSNAGTGSTGSPSQQSEPQQSEPQQSEPQQGGDAGASNQPSKPQVRETAQAEVRKALDDLIKDEDITETVDAITEALDGGLPDLGIDTTTSPMLTTYVNLSDSISMQMEETLNKWVSAKAPVWSHRVENGRVNPLAYRSRTAGDRNFFDSYSGDGGQLLDVHLSLLCDNSGSMSNHMQELSAVVKGTCDACDAVGIPRTVTLWSDPTYTSPVWQDRPAEYETLPTGGGTDPRYALDDLEHHNTTARKVHLVVIFTDGDWYANYTLRDWDSADCERRYVLVRYGDIRNVRTYGADVATTVHNVSELATVICASLDDTLSTVTL